MQLLIAVEEVHVEGRGVWIEVDGGIVAAVHLIVVQCGSPVLRDLEEVYAKHVST